jgi:murein L,D-transpeptidase YafK
MKYWFRKTSKVDRRQKIGSIGDAHGVHIAHLHFEIRKESMKELPPDFWPSSEGKDLAWVKENYENPTDFINRHRKCTHPASSSQMMIAVKNEYKMYHLRNGEIYKTYEIALSQDPVGHKLQQGDNRLARGRIQNNPKTQRPYWWRMG